MPYWKQLLAARGQRSGNMSEGLFRATVPSFLAGVVRLFSSFGDLCQQDMGTGLPFRPATFDGCISVSALQVGDLFARCWSCAALL